MATKGGGGRQKAADPAKRKVAATRQRARARKGRTIDAAAEAAKTVRATGRKSGMGSAQLAFRNSAIVARRAQGRTERAIAEEFECGVRTVQRVLKEYRETPSGMDTLPMQTMEDLIRDCRAMIADFEALGVALVKDHPSAGVAAFRQARDARADLVGLQRMLGLLPTNLGLFRAEADVAHLGQTMLDELARFEAGEISAEEVARRVREDVFSEAMRGLPTRT